MKELDDYEICQLIRRIIWQVDATINDYSETLRVQVRPLIQAGIVAGMHVGKTDLSHRMIMEWYAGQLLCYVEEDALLAINRLISQLDKFVPDDIS